MPTKPTGPDQLIVPPLVERFELPTSVTIRNDALRYRWNDDDKTKPKTVGALRVNIRRFRALATGTNAQIRDYAAEYGPLGTLVKAGTVVEYGPREPTVSSRFEFGRPESEPLQHWRDLARIAQALYQLSSRARDGKTSTPEQRAILTTTSNPVLPKVTWPDIENELAIAERDRRNVASVLTRWVYAARVVPVVDWFPSGEITFRLRTPTILGPLGLALIDEIEIAGRRSQRHRKTGRIIHASIECDECHELYTPKGKPRGAAHHYCSKKRCQRKKNRVEKARQRDKKRCS